MTEQLAQLIAAAIVGFGFGFAFAGRTWQRSEQEILRSAAIVLREIASAEDRWTLRFDEACALLSRWLDWYEQQSDEGLPPIEQTRRMLGPSPPEPSGTVRRPRR